MPSARRGQPAGRGFLHAPLHLGAREVLVSIIDRLEPAAVDRDANLAAERDEPSADLADGAAVILAEIGDRLVIRNEALRQSHHFDVATGLALEPAARLDPARQP